MNVSIKSNNHLFIRLIQYYFYCGAANSIKIDHDFFTDVVTTDFKNQIPIVLKLYNITKEDALIHVSRQYECQNFQHFFGKN